MRTILYQNIYADAEAKRNLILDKFRDIKPDLVYRCINRGNSTALKGERFDNYKEMVRRIKLQSPNVKLIGNIYCQILNYFDIDDITNKKYGYKHVNLQSDYIANLQDSILIDSKATFETWNIQVGDLVYNKKQNKLAYVQSVDSETKITTKTFSDSLNWNNVTYNIGSESYDLAFNPKDYGVNITKFDFQTENLSYVRNKNWWPDITKSEVQNFLINQAKRIIDIGGDAIFFDGLVWQARNYRHYKWQPIDPGRELALKGSIKVVEEVKKYKTLSGDAPLIISWIPYQYLEDFTKRQIYPFDMLVGLISLPEIRDNKPKDIWWDPQLELVKNYYNNVPVLPIIDWGFGKHQLWYFSQSILDKKERQEHEKSILRNFTCWFKNKYQDYNISFVYPIFGGSMCEGVVSSPCLIKSYGTSSIWSSFAPEFDIYQDIINIMDENCKQV